MIYTFTPNPALDLGGTVDAIVPDEKNYVHDETRFPGGNAINVARVITTLGGKAVATGFLGGGAGADIASLLTAEGVRHDFVSIQAHTRTNVTVSNRKTHRQTRLSFPGPRIQASEKRILTRKLLRVSRLEMLVIGGSLPPGYSDAELGSLSKTISRQRNVPVLVDVPGSALSAAVKARCFFIKPNLTEFQDLIGKSVKTKSAVLREARKITDRVPLICVSSVEGGALLVTPRSAWYAIGPRVKAKSTVGAGDSMVGAMAHGLWRRKVLSTVAPNFAHFEERGAQDVLRISMAAALATVITPGTELARRTDVKKFAPLVRLRRL